MSNPPRPPPVDEKDLAFVHNERKVPVGTPTATPAPAGGERDIEVARDSKTTDSSVIQEGEVEKADEERTPSADDQLEALGIPNWRELEKRLVKRLDMTLLPCLWVLYLFNYLDRSSIGQARISTMETDIGLTGSEFSTAVSILSYGYIIGQIPSNMIMTRVRPHIYLPAMAMVWSGVSAATCGVTNAQGLWAVRFMLGVVEAPLFPGALMMVGCWYTRRELAFRYSLLYSAQTIGFSSAGLIAAAVFSTLEGKHGLAGWQWLFIVLAVTGAGLAIICYFLLPDYPHSESGSTMWTMTEDMRLIARVRMQADRTMSSVASPGVWRGLLMAVTDHKMWLVAFANISVNSANSFNNFFPSIVRGFGRNTTVTLLMTAPPYLWATLLAFINSWHSDRTKERYWHFSLPLALGTAGYIVCLATSDSNARYGASYIYAAGVYMSNPLTSTWAATTLARTPEKRAISIACINVLGQIGNIAGPYFYREEEEPGYQFAFIMMTVMSFVGVFMATLLTLWLRRSNKKLYKRAQANGTHYQPYIT